MDKNLFDYDPNEKLKQMKYEWDEMVRGIRENRKREAEEREAHTIYLDGRHPDPTKLLHRAIKTGDMRGPWQDAALVPAMRAAAKAKAKLEAEELVPAPEPEF